MITKNKSKNTYYIERDTIAGNVLEKVIVQLVKELKPLIEENISLLKSKETVDWRTLDVTAKIGNTEIQNLIRFYKSAIITGYYRQEYGNWERKISSKELQRTDTEIKAKVGFMERGIDGNLTDIPNSITTFKLVKDFLQFLTDVENVCFEDNGYIFPDTKEYKAVEKAKGKDIAKIEWLDKLKEHIKNKYPDRKIV